MSANEYDSIFVGFPFHLFDWEKQMKIMRQCIELLYKTPESLLFGHHLAHIEPDVCQSGFERILSRKSCMGRMKPHGSVCERSSANKWTLNGSAGRSWMIHRNRRLSRGIGQGRKRMKFTITRD